MKRLIAVLSIMIGGISITLLKEMDHALVTAMSDAWASESSILAGWMILGSKAIVATAVLTTVTFLIGKARAT